MTSVLKSLSLIADPTRVRLLLLLKQEELSVAELQEIVDGVSGFTLPTEPANEVYPGVLLGDA